MDLVNVLIDSPSEKPPGGGHQDEATGPQASALSTRRPGASGR